MAADLRIPPPCVLPPATAAAAPAAAPAGAESKRLERAAQDFESLLVGTMLRTMRATTQALSGSGDEDSTGSAIMHDVMDEHLAVALARGGGLGLGNLLGARLEEQRRRQEHTEELQAAVEPTGRKEMP